MKKFKEFLKKRIFSSTVSIVLSICVLLSAFSGVLILAGVLPTVWSGETATGFAQGSGTEADPFIVSNGEELALAVSSTGRDADGNQYYYSMSSNIYLNDITNAAWKDDASNNEWAFADLSQTGKSQAFSGVFNGNGYKIYGLFIKESFAAPGNNSPDTTKAAGLFPTVTTGAEISGVGIENSYIALTNNHSNSGYARAGMVGALVGYVYADFNAPVKIDRCYSSTDVHLTGAYAGLVGGISIPRENSGKTALRMDSCYTVSSATVFFDWESYQGNRLMLLSSMNSNNLTANYCYTTGGFGFYDLISETGATNYTCNWIPNTTVFTKVSQDAMKGDGALSASGMARLADCGDYVTTGSYPALKIFVDRETVLDVDIWDGSKVAPSKGSGSEDDPWLIETPEELAFVVANGGSSTNNHYKLANDIYLNDITKIDWKTGTVAAGYTPKTWVGYADHFNGTLDGDGHTVYGMYYKSTSTKAWGYSGVGLVGKILSGDVANVKRIGIDCAYLEHKNAAGGIIGYLNSGGIAKVDECFVGADVTLYSWEAGAIVSMAPGGTFEISNCYSLANVRGEHLYGLYGQLYGGGVSASSISNCYNANGPISTNSAPGTIANCYATAGSLGTILTKDKMQGEDALYASDKMPSLGNSFLATASYPVINFDRIIIDPTPDYVWDGTTTAPTEGEGTEDAPYIIKTAEEFVYVMRSGGNGKFYKLANSIYLNDIDKIDWTTGQGKNGYTPRGWTGVPETWNGTIDGDGYTVYGLYRNHSGSFSWGWSGSGLINKLINGSKVTFKNLGLDYLYIIHENSAGGFVGYAENCNLTLNKCFVGANAYVKGYSAGTLFGMAPGGVFNVTNCYSLGTAERGSEASDSMYGLHGQVYGGNGASTMTNCYNANGPITTGVTAGVFKNCYATSGTKGTVISAENMQGADVLVNADKMPNLGKFFKATASYPVIDYEAQEYTEPDYVWDGTMSAPTKGSGSFEAPYLIENAEQFAYIVKNGGGKGKNYKLTADIYLNDITMINWATGEINEEYTVKTWGTIGGLPDTFSGTIDGDGHVVYGLYNNSTSAMAWGYNGAGLINKIVSGDVVMIKNLGVDCAYVKHHNAASAFIGYNNNGATASIDKCYVGEQVHLEGYETGAFIGQAPGGQFSLTNCYSLATIVRGPGEDSAYGLYGQAYGAGASNSSVMHCFNANGPIGTKVDNHKNNYCTEASGIGTVISAENMQGMDVFENVAKMSMLNRTKAFVATDKFPILKIFSSDPSIGGGTDEVWDGLVINAFAQGSGTKNDPYIISNGSELAFAVGTQNGWYFKLSKDIYLNDTSSNGWYLQSDLNEWFTTKRFSGHIDGDGHSVYGIWYPAGNEYTYTGLIPRMTSGSIKNLGIRYSYITAKRFAAGFVSYIEGWSGNQVTIENCMIDDSSRIGFTGTETWNDASYGAGGFVAYLYGYDQTKTPAECPVTLTINNCYSKTTIDGTSTNRMNGMIGTIWLSNYSIKNSYSVGYPITYSGGNTMAYAYYDFNTSANTGIPVSDLFVNNYSDVTNGSVTGVFNTVPAIKDWHGDKAKTSLKGLDYQNVWETVNGGTPKLRIFKDITGEDISLPDPTGTFASGKGTKNDPYIIKNAKHLRNMVELKVSAGKYFVLANDIYVNDTTNKNWKKNAVEWLDGKDLPIFGGNFDGAGHTVYGLYVNNTPTTGSNLSTSATGLIPRVAMDATVKNVHLRDSYISGTGYAGAIIGYTNGSSKGKYVRVIGCSADETVTVSGQAAGGILGGGPSAVQMYYCYFTGKLSATSEGRCNALLGDIWNGDCQVVECYSIGYESYRNVPQNIVGVYGTVEDAKVTVLTTAQMTGANAKKNMTGLSFNTYWYTANGKTPQLKVVDENNLGYVFKDEGVKGRVWSGKIATKFAGGTGTEEDPFLIETPEQLAYMFYRGAGSSSYKLIADIKLNDTTKADWEKTANPWFSGRNYTFSGHFDGNGHVITGLYFENQDSICALFPYVYYNSIIENLGIDDSSIINPSSDGNKQSYSGALVGYIESWQSATASNYKHPPIIRKCFVGDGVYVEGFFAGGLVAGCAKSAVFEDCYVTCELTGSSMSGAFIATAWDGQIPITVTNCYASTVNGDNFISNGASKGAVYTNVYHDGTRGSCPKEMNIISMYFMQGSQATTYLKGFDFNKVWRTVEGGTPVLRVFKNAAKYTCTREPNKVEISFATNGGDVIEPIYGFGYTDIEGEIPTPVRYGYKFLGWYYTPNFAVKFDLTKFPPNDMILYAKWEETGYEYGFEGDLDTEYDILGNIEHYRPGVSGYHPLNVKEGLKALHIFAENDIDPIFLVNYRWPLEVGKEYEITFWVRTATDETVTIDFLYAEHPQANSPVVGYEKIVDAAGGKAGEWKQYKAIITAAAPYLLVRTSKGVEVFYDGFQMVETENEGNLDNVIGMNPEDIQTEPGLTNDATDDGISVWLIVGIAGGVVLLGGIATAATLIIKKRKKA